MTTGVVRAAMWRAVLRGEIRCLYRPVVDLASGAPVGAEVVVRWSRREGVVQMPEEVLRSADARGVARALGRFVLERACNEAASWPAPEGRWFGVWVGVSRPQLEDGRLVDDVGRALLRSGLDPSRLVVELAGSALLVDLAGAAGQLAALRGAGVHVALDELGTGCSSLERLVRLPSDTVKVEPSLVAGLRADGRSRAMVAALVELGRRLGLRVVAEGIEHEEQRAVLEALGCHLGQGPHFGPPVEGRELLDLFAPDPGPPRLGVEVVGERQPSRLPARQA